MNSSGAAPDHDEVQPNRSALHVLIIALVATTVCLPVLLYGVPDLANDGVEHARWARHFSIQFWQGDLYPRWLAGVNAGLGAPTFFLYPPLASFAAAIFWPVSHGFDSFGWRTAGFAATLGLGLSGVTAYIWLRSMVDSRSALFGAVVYMILPYHVAIDLYNRGAVAELWSFVWMPLILLSVEHIIRGRRGAFLACAASYAALVFSHLLITLGFSLVPVAAAFFLSEQGQRTRTAIRVGAAMALGIGLAAVFVVPAMLDQHKTYITQVLAEDYRQWWLFQRQPLLNYKTRILVITLSTIGFTAVLFWIFRRHGPAPAARRRGSFYAAVAFTSFYFMTQASALVWKAFPPLRFLQFPPRFSTVLCVAASAIAALSFRSVIQMRKQLALWGIGLVMTSWMGADGWGASMAFRKWRPIPANTIGVYFKRIQLENEYGAYASITTPPNLVGDPLRLERFIAEHPPRAALLENAITGRPSGAASVSTWRSRRVILEINAAENSHMTLNHFYYPGWKGYIPTLGKELLVRPSQPDGLLQMELPKGAYALILTLDREWPERAGMIISIVSLAIAIGIAVGTALQADPLTSACVGCPPRALRTPHV